MARNEEIRFSSGSLLRVLWGRDYVGTYEWVEGGVCTYIGGLRCGVYLGVVWMGGGEGCGGLCVCVSGGTRRVGQSGRGRLGGSLGPGPSLFVRAGRRWGWGPTSRHK